MIRFLASLLTALLLYSGAGFILTFEIGLANVRKEVQKLLQSEEKGSLVTLKFHRSATIHFKDEGKEIYLEGQMYDILQKEQRGDSLIFLCFHDVEESKQLQAFTDQVQDFSDGANQKNQKKEKSFRGKQEYIEPDLIPFQSVSLSSHTQTPAHNDNPIEVTPSVPYPPPKFC